MTSAGPTPGGTFLLGGRSVNRVGFGAMRLLLLGADRGSAIALLHRAVELGVNHFDTAAYYGDGLVNGLLRDSAARSADVVIVTKVGAVSAPSGAAVPFRPAQKPSELREGVESNLRTLGRDRLDVVNLRRHDDAPGDQRVDIDDQLAELVGLREAGLIGAIGLSATDSVTLARARPAGIVCVQNQYSVLERSDEELLDSCARDGIAWVPYFPLGGGGHLGTANVVEHPTVLRIASELRVTASQVGLAWLLQHTPSTLVIPGTSSISHLEENITTTKLQLPPGVVAELDTLASASSPA